MSETLDLIKRALAFITGHVDLLELEKAVLDAELASPGLESAVTAIKTNETLIFKDPVARVTADAVLGLLVDARKAG